MNESLEAVLELARVHYENSKADITFAHTRIEHIRATTLAQEAEVLYTELQHLTNLLEAQHAGPQAI